MRIILASTTFKIVMFAVCIEEFVSLSKIGIHIDLQSNAVFVV